MRIIVVSDFHGKFPANLKKIVKRENADVIVGLGDYAGISDWRPYIDYLFKEVNESNRNELLSASDFFGEKKYKNILEKDFQAGKRVLSEIKKLGKPVIFVFGNGDDVWYRYPFVKHGKKWAIDKRALKFVKKLGFKDITYGSTKFDGLRFVGFGGYMDAKANYEGYEKKLYNEVMRRVRLSRKKLFSIARKAKNADIFVFHYPPSGIFDRISDRKNPYHGKSTGIEFFREAIRKFKPKVALCGHMHEYQGAKMLGDTLVVNPGDAERGRFAVIDFNYPKIDVRFFR